MWERPRVDLEKLSSNVGREGKKRCGREGELIWEELSSNVGREGKKDMGGRESRFGRNCPQMLGGRVKKM